MRKRFTCFARHSLGVTDCRLSILVVPAATRARKRAQTERMHNLDG
jgi:hypothetical protein